MPLRCPNCTEVVHSNSYAQHFRRRPLCDPKNRRESSGLESHQGQASNNSSQAPLEAEVAATEFKYILSLLVMSDLNTLEYKKFVKKGKLDAVVTMALGWLQAIAVQIDEECKISATAGQLATGVKGVLACASRVLQSSHSAAQRRSFNLRSLRAPYVEPRLYRSVSEATARKSACSFALIPLLSRVLQRSTSMRVRTALHGTNTNRPTPSHSVPQRAPSTRQEACIAKSEWLKTGALHMQSACVVRSVFDSDKSRFDPDLMRKARPDEANVLRVLLQVE